MGFNGKILFLETTLTRKKRRKEQNKRGPCISDFNSHLSLPCKFSWTVSIKCAGCKLTRTHGEGIFDCELRRTQRVFSSSICFLEVFHFPGSWFLVKPRKFLYLGDNSQPPLPNQ